MFLNFFKFYPTFIHLKIPIQNIYFVQTQKMFFRELGDQL